MNAAGVISEQLDGSFARRPRCCLCCGTVFAAAIVHGLKPTRFSLTAKVRVRAPLSHPLAVEKAGRNAAASRHFFAAGALEFVHALVTELRAVGPTTEWGQRCHHTRSCPSADPKVYQQASG